MGSLLSFRVATVMADICDNTDLAGDISWKSWLEGLGAVGSMWSLPCSTFSRGRPISDSPRVVRAADGPHLFGLPDLDPTEHEHIGLGTFFTFRS